MKKYVPDLSLLTTWNKTKHFYKHSVIMAIFEFDNKHLIYIGGPHNPKKESLANFDAINYAFKNFNIDCVVTEIDHTYKSVEEEPVFNLGKKNANDLAYSAYIARKQNIPYIFADVSYYDLLSFVHNKSIKIQTMAILKNSKAYTNIKKKNEPIEHALKIYKMLLSKLGYDTKLTLEQLKKSLEKNFAIDISDGTIKISDTSESRKPKEEINLFLRDPYMVKEIFKAINKYKNVLVTMGRGHYETQRLVFEKSFGRPKYLDSFPKSKRVDIL